MGAGQLEQVVSAGSEGSGGQLARTSDHHYIEQVASDSLAHSWMHWGDATSHVMARWACRVHDSATSAMVLFWHPLCQACPRQSQCVQVGVVHQLCEL